MKKQTKFLAIGAGIIGVAALVKRKKEAKEAETLKNIFGLTANPEQGGTDATLLEQMKNSPEVKAYIKSLGLTGEQVVNQINNNVYSLDNVNYQNFGRSLLKNGAFELGDLTDWANTILSETLVLGNRVGKSTDAVLNGMTNTEKFYLRKDCLTKVSAFIKTTGSVELRVYPWTINDVASTNNLTSPTAYITASPATHTNSSFEWKNFYFGGNKSNSVFSGAEAAIKAHFRLQEVTGETEFHSLIVSYVSLGEPVPSNLPWLPVNQMVYDTTTFEVGIYNGTTVVWFAI